MTDYTTTGAVKAYLRVSGAGDDALLAELVTRASGLIDTHCGRWFSARTETRRYDASGPHITGRLLLLDADLLSVTAITNGDGTAITPAQIILRPNNWPPYFGVALRATTGLHWVHGGSPEGAISIEGTWGYSPTPPPDIVQASIRLSAWLYRQRDTGTEGLTAEPAPVVITPRGAALAPSRLPNDVLNLLNPYRRVRITSVA